MDSTTQRKKGDVAPDVKTANYNSASKNKLRDRKKDAAPRPTERRQKSPPLRHASNSTRVGESKKSLENGKKGRIKKGTKLAKTTARKCWTDERLSVT